MWLARGKYKLVGIIYCVQVKRKEKDGEAGPWTHAHPISIRPGGGGDSHLPSQPINHSFLFGSLLSLPPARHHVFTPHRRSPPTPNMLAFASDTSWQLQLRPLNPESPP